MDDVYVHEFDTYDVDVIDPNGKKVTYKGIAGGSSGIMPDDTLVEERKVGTVAWISVFHYQNDVDLDAEYTPFPDSNVRLVLYFDNNYNLIDPEMMLLDSIDEYRKALIVCTKYQELTKYVPYIIRWLHDHGETEVLRI